MRALQNVQPSGFNQTPIFSIEENFPEVAFFEWINRHWTLSLWFCVFYVTALFSGRRFMQTRPALDLRPTLALWSTFLALFSILGTVRTLPEMLFVLKQRGLQYAVCTPSYYVGPSKFWACAFTLSKVLELGDTFFIVARKQKLMFLHWYHHITVMVYCWYSFTEWQATGMWFMVMNFGVHSLMYTYYVLKALRYRVPRQVAMVITLLQLSQMVVGLLVNGYAYRVKTRGHYCQVGYFSIKMSVTMYASYFVLFAHFFIDAYFGKKSPKSQEGVELNHNSVKKVE